MTRIYLIFGLILISLISACKGSSNRIDNIQQVDTAKSMKTGDFWVMPKPTFELNSILDSSQDTLRLITCAEYVYSPFGKLDKKSDINKSLLNKFTIADKIDTMDNGVFEFQILKNKTSRLILFFDNDPEATKHSSIFKGVIIDKDVDLVNGIRIGMDKEHFIKTFFDYFPSQLLEKYNYIALESCVQDIRHTYRFKDDKLQSIDFKTDSYWTVDY